MTTIYRSLFIAALAALPATATWAQTPDLNPGNSGGGHVAIGYPQEGQADPSANPALTTGSRFNVTSSTPADENPTVPGATGRTIVRGDRSTISNDRRATIQQKTGAMTAADAPG
jgi:hypothetical protein